MNDRARIEAAAVGTFFSADCAFVLATCSRSWMVTGSRSSVIPPSEHLRGRMPRRRESPFGYLAGSERGTSMYFEISPNRVVQLGTRAES